VKRILARILAVAFLLLAAVYAGDYASVRFAIPAGKQVYGSVSVKPFYEIHQKNGKTEFDFSMPAEIDTCVNSLFPHFGYPTCWYLNRHTQKKIEI
jgi:hypothetical protein